MKKELTITERSFIIKLPRKIPSKYQEKTNQVVFRENPDMQTPVFRGFCCVINNISAIML